MEEKIQKDFRRTSWAYVKDGVLKSNYEGLKNSQRYSLIFAQNQVIDERSYANNHLTEDQLHDLTELSESLIKIKHYYSSIQRHHHTALFDRNEMLTMKRSQIDDLFVQNYDRYNDFKTYLNKMINKKHDEVEQKITFLRSVTDERLTEMQFIQEFMDNYKSTDAEFKDNVDYNELGLIGLMFLTNVMVLYKLNKKNSTHILDT